MKTLLHEIRLLVSGLVFGFALMPALLWYIYFKYDVQLVVYNANSLVEFYREIYSGLDVPQTWFSLLLPYLLLRLVLLLFRTKTPRPLTKTSLAHAAMKGREDTVRTLLTDGNDINAGNRNGETPLHLAAEQGNSDIVKILLEQGAMVDAVETAAGYTPLHYAARQGHSDLCDLLIRFGADPDALTENLDSPLHLAIEKGRAGVVRVLLKYHARLDTKNRKGQTPLQLAEHLANQEIANLINQHLSETWPYLQISRR
jgi:hypothetical protein